MRLSPQDNGDDGWSKPPRQPLLNVPDGVAILVYLSLAVHVLRMFLPDRIDTLVLFLGGFIPVRLTELVSGAVGFSLWDILGRVAPLIGYAFLHADWMHVIFNLMWLMVFGSIVGRRLGEDREGTIRLIEIFLISGIAGALVHWVLYLNGVIPLIGGSAGVSGLMGAAARVMFAPFDFTAFKQPHIAPLTDRRVVGFTLVFVVINLVIGFLGGGLLGVDGSVAWQAHIGGFVAGLLIYPLFDRLQRR